MWIELDSDRFSLIWLLPTDDILEAINPWLDDAIEQLHGRYSKQDVIKEILEGDLKLHGIYRDYEMIGFCILDIIRYPSATAMLLFLAGGKDVMEWFEWLNGEIEKIARRTECDMIEIWGRRGWERLLSRLDGWEKPGIYMTRVLK